MSKLQTPVSKRARLIVDSKSSEHGVYFSRYSLNTDMRNAIASKTNCWRSPWMWEREPAGTLHNSSTPHSSITTSRLSRNSQIILVSTIYFKTFSLICTWMSISSKVLSIVFFVELCDVEKLYGVIIKLLTTTYLLRLIIFVFNIILKLGIEDTSA